MSESDFFFGELYVGNSEATEQCEIAAIGCY